MRGDTIIGYGLIQFDCSKNAEYACNVLKYACISEVGTKTITEQMINAAIEAVKAEKKMKIKNKVKK